MNRAVLFLKENWQHMVSQKENWQHTHDPCGFCTLDRLQQELENVNLAREGHCTWCTPKEEVQKYTASLLNISFRTNRGCLHHHPHVTPGRGLVVRPHLQGRHPLRSSMPSTLTSEATARQACMCHPPSPDKGAPPIKGHPLQETHIYSSVITNKYNF